jgi:hypothetical protein
VTSRNPRYVLLLILAGTAVYEVTAWWPQIRDEWFVVSGARYEGGAWYGWWSGQAGGLQPVAWLVLAVLLYWHRTCHRQWCLRLGRHDFTDESTGLTYKLCAHCHPAHPGHPLTLRHIALIHDRNRAGRP